MTRIFWCLNFASDNWQHSCWAPVSLCVCGQQGAATRLEAEEAEEEEKEKRWCLGHHTGFTATCLQAVGTCE